MRAVGGIQSSYLSHVDGLRAVAIGTVVAFHAWPSVMPGGFIGVDVFFVISGFLITRLVLAEIDQGTFSLFGFLARRARRLLPAALVCFAIVSLIAGRILLPDAYLDFGRSLLAAALMFANVHFYRTAGYFSAPAHEKPLLHTWSLSVEDQFYLTWPVLLLVLAPRLPRVWLLAIAGVLAAASLVHAEATVGKHASYAFFILMPRAWELLLGCLLAVALPFLRPSERLAEALGAIGFAGVLASALLLSSDSRFPGLSAVPACLGAAAMILSGLRGETLMSRALSWRPLVLGGLVSYSLYLWHWPLLALAKYALGRGLTPVEASAIVAASLGIAVLSWRFVERPFRLHGAVPWPIVVRTLAVAGGSIAAFAVAGGLIKILDGLPGRFPGPIGSLFADMGSGNPLRIPCDGSERVFGTDAICSFGRRKEPDQSYQIAIFGDSNADHFVPMVARWAETEGLTGRQVTQSMCAPLIGAANKRWSNERNGACATFQQQMMVFVERNPGLEVAILAANWGDNLEGLFGNGVTVGDASPRDEEAASFEAYLRRTVVFLRSRGIRVHILGQIPSFEVLPVTCIVSALQSGGDPAACGAARSLAGFEPVRSDAVIRRVTSDIPGVTFESLIDAFCDEQRCVPMKDGVFLYRDPGHLSAAGAMLLARSFSLPKR